jgi:hypothetical protein
MAAKRESGREAPIWITPRMLVQAAKQLVGLLKRRRQT